MRMGKEGIGTRCPRQPGIMHCPEFDWIGEFVIDNALHRVRLLTTHSSNFSDQLHSLGVTIDIIRGRGCNRIETSLS